MKLMMITGDRHVLQGKKSAFWYTLHEMEKHWDRIDVLCPRVDTVSSLFTLVQGSFQNKELSEKVFFHPGSTSWLNHPRWLAEKGLSLFLAHQHDVLTVHEYPPFYNGRGASKLHKLTNIPTVLEIHHIVGYPKAASFSEWIGCFLSRWYIAKESRFAKAVRTVNHTVADKLGEWGVSKKKIAIVPSFYLDGSLHRDSLIPAKIFDLAFCARLVPNKGLEQVLEATAQIDDATLVVIGDGPKRKEYEKLAKKLKIQDRVTFLGWLPNLETVIGAVTSARLFVMNSKSEGGPRSALEAMASGMPVLSTRTGIMTEVIDDGRNGVFLDGTAKDLAVKAFYLLKDEKAQKHMGEEAREVLHRFDRATLVKQYADFLKAQI